MGQLASKRSRDNVTASALPSSAAGSSSSRGSLVPTSVAVVVAPTANENQTVSPVDKTIPDVPGNRQAVIREGEKTGILEMFFLYFLVHYIRKLNSLARVFSIWKKL